MTQPTRLRGSATPADPAPHPLDNAVWAALTGPHTDFRQVRTPGTVAAAGAL
ncbi:hypothetical protein [Streptomyces olivaceus]|uniref:hypothetical protein n=1 Tax=Streptomyces olivaceus TaxID=47716 RepID=UPI0037196726